MAATPKRELMRAALFGWSRAEGHNRPMLTMDRYSHGALNEQASVLAKMPDLRSAAGHEQRAIGTDGRSAIESCARKTRDFPKFFKRMGRDSNPG